MDVLFVALGPASEACSRVRIHQYLPHLAADGIRATIEPFFRHSGAGIRRRSPISRARESAYVWRRTLGLLPLLPRYDCVVLQRVLLPLALLRAVRRRSRALVFDVDDAIYTRPGASGPLARPLGRFIRTVGAADAVTVSTPSLAERIRPHQPHTVLLPSTVDCERYRPRPKDAARPPVLGWVGSPSTSPYLIPILPALRDVCRTRPGVTVQLLGASGLPDGGGVTSVAWHVDEEPGRVAGFDIGLMPLPDDEWTRGKAGYKLLLYMAAGLPAVASPVGANRKIVRDGVTGAFATSPAEWATALTRLVDDRALRASMGAHARRAVEDEYDTRRWAGVYSQTLRDAAAAGASR